MGSKEFIEKCKEIVKQYAMEHLDKSDNIPEFEVFDVWYCKTLQNLKHYYQHHYLMECTMN